MAAVCHGPAALFSAMTPEGQWAYKGYRVTCFSNREETAVGLADKVPFSLESRMVENGGPYSHADLWQPYMVRDRDLITGQNPASSALIADDLLAALAEGN